MDSSEPNQLPFEDFEAQHRALQDLLRAQDDVGALPVLVQEATEPTAFERWLQQAFDQFGRWFDGSLAGKQTYNLMELIDWESTLLILSLGLVLVVLFAVFQYVIRLKRGQTKFVAVGDGSKSSTQPATDDEYLTQLLASKRYAEAMLMRWRIFQQRLGLGRHITPLEYCHGHNVGDRSPVNQAYRYMFGHTRADSNHYQAFDQWLRQREGELSS